MVGEWGISAEEREGKGKVCYHGRRGSPCQLRAERGKVMPFEGEGGKGVSGVVRENRLWKAW